MAKLYIVRMPVTGIINVEVEAESEKELIQKMYALDWSFELEVESVTGVEIKEMEMCSINEADVQEIGEAE